MTRTDHALIGALVLALAIVAAAIGAPALLPAGRTASPTPALAEIVPYREGVLGRPASVNPLAARTQADRDLVALSFSGLVRLGPRGTLVPDLAESWTTDEAGTTWTFRLREGLRWHDGEPLTVDDILFTIAMLKDPAYVGPGAGSWREVEASASGERSITFTLATALGGFLELTTQPIAPRHLLGDVAPELLADDPFGRAPIGSGPFAIVELDPDHAVLEPAASAAAPADEASEPPIDSPLPTDTIATPAPTERPNVAAPQLNRLEFRFFDDAEALSAAFLAGDLDAASGLSNVAAAALADEAPDARLLRYPGTTLTAVALNLRPSHPELRDPRTRTGLLGAIDRAAVIEGAWAGLAEPADAVIPPTSWAFDPAASAPLAFDAAAAATQLTAAGWTKVDDAWRPAGATTPYTLDLMVPLQGANPVLYEVASAIAEDWTALGLTTRLVEVDPGAFVVDHLQPGDFTAAVVDVAVGHDPDPYPLLASSQTRTGGLNVSGVQDAALDALLAAARGPGTLEARKAAYTALQTALTAGRYLLPIAWADEPVVVRRTVVGPAIREVADPSDRFWDVLGWRLAVDR